jgi:hypothetical protein
MDQDMDMDTHRFKQHRAQRGSALLMALVAVIGVSVLAAGLLQVSSAAMRRSQTNLDNRRAFYLAEAGLAEGYAGLAEGFSGNVGTQAVPARYGEGLFWVESEFLESGHVVLESTGMCGSGRATLALVAQPVVSSVTGLGIFSGSSVRVEPSSLIDGYDSSLGSYESQADMTASPPHTAGGAMLGSNGDITIAGGRAGSAVYGDVTPGPSGTYSTAGTVTVTGSTSPSGEVAVLPPVDVPVVSKLPATVHSSATPLVIPPSTIGYTSLRMGPGTKLVIQGPATVVFNDLMLDASAQLEVDPSGGRVDIYIENSVNFASGSLINCLSTNPALLTMMVSSEVDPSAADNVQLNASGRFYGTLYTPRSNTKVAAGFEVFGALVAQRLTLSNGGKLHVDAELASNSSANPLPRMVSWRIIDIPQNVASNRVDPFVALGVDPATLPLARDAHADVWMEITYKDALNVTQTYSGWSSGMDWTQVSSLQSYRTYTNDPLLVDSVPIQEKSSTIMAL